MIFFSELATSDEPPLFMYRTDILGAFTRKHFGKCYDVEEGEDNNGSTRSGSKELDKQIVAMDRSKQIQFLRLLNDSRYYKHNVSILTIFILSNNAILGITNKTLINAPIYI